MTTLSKINTTCAKCGTAFFADPTQHQWFTSVEGVRIFFCGQTCCSEYQCPAEIAAAEMGLEHHFPHW